ncbi:ketol-acid reductoisomerase [Neomoorella thermoacetica]|uniref:ketol-acid reductoisomerase n=1 Tax=Neomoorella thermoacetica TaxID=1525 RepID=UPI0008FB614D|nr:ketol-acid reductoisomerase [Moorella thermoacetica]OIQ55579.1 ketol-acid reductoisomerase [Moorella thermoacetica]
MPRYYYDSDADINHLKDKVISIIGYGNQGRAQALNMRDSGIKNIIIGNQKDSSFDQACEDGWEVMSIAEAAKKGDIIFMLLPDEVAPEIYKKDIHPYLKPKDVLNFASGYNITYHLIEPPSFVDIIMLAPRMIGDGVREMYRKGEGFPSFISIKQDFSGTAKDVCLALAKAIGSTKKGVLEIDFDHETYLDLFTELATFPLIISILKMVFEFEQSKGFAIDEILQELYLSKEPAIIFSRIAEVGLLRQLKFHSRTSQYGHLSRSLYIQNNYKQLIWPILEKAFDEIINGDFASEWIQEQSVGCPKFKKLWDNVNKDPITLAEDSINESLKK